MKKQLLAEIGQKVNEVHERGVNDVDLRRLFYEQAIVKDVAGKAHIGCHDRAGSDSPAIDMEPRIIVEEGVSARGADPAEQAFFPRPVPSRRRRHG